MTSVSDSWVERIRMVPIPLDSLSKTLTADGNNGHAPAAVPATVQRHSRGSDSTATTAQQQHCLEFNIISMNMLAESYLSPRSHQGLPDRYANVAFDSSKRRKLLVDTFERFCNPRNFNSKNGNGGDDSSSSSSDEQKWDILALQELDLVQPDDDPILPAFQSWGYQVIRTPNDARKDCCAIAFDTTKFTLLKYEVVKFDDLATLYRSTATNNDNVKSTSSSSSSSSPELTGLVRSFLRRNCAIVAHLKSVDTMQSFIVASVHLYWNPGFEYVKLCQAKYLLDRVAEFATVDKEVDQTTTKLPMQDHTAVMLLPTVICGDMNSKPGSVVHGLFVKPCVDATDVAPWNYCWDHDGEIMYTEDQNIAKGGEDTSGVQDSVVKPDSDLINKRGQREIEDGLNGYTMNGFPDDFEMYCGFAVDDKTSIQSGRHEPCNPRNVHIDGDDEIDVTYDGLRSSLLSWNGLHKRTLDISSSSTDHRTTDDAATFDDDGLRASLAWSRLHQRNTPQDYQHSLPPLKIKYMLDYTLNRFTR